MKKEIRAEVKRFFTSEAGRVGVRAPLALGVASGAFLISQMVYTPSAEASCVSDDDCGSDGRCEAWCEEYSKGTCKEWKSGCVYDC
ncbi:hypothetical protein F4055_05170 [Candidatus Poribacteria bacterium]|nr:hypothetical protein [Candidatus Poribacteria bacterium]